MKLDNLKAVLDISRMEATTTLSLWLSKGAKRALKKNEVEGEQ